MDTAAEVVVSKKDAAGDWICDPRVIDALRWRFEIIFKLGLVVLVSSILSAALMPVGPWSFYKGTALKVPAARLNLIADLFPPFRNLGFRLSLFSVLSYAFGWEAAIIYLRLNCRFYSSGAISATHRRRFFLAAVLTCLVVYLCSLCLIAAEEVAFGALLLCSVSISSVAGFKLASNSSSVMAMWVLAQSLAVFLFLANAAGNYIGCVFAIFPIIPAIYSILIPVDNLYNRLVENPYKETEEDKNGYRANDISINEAKFRVLTYFVALATISVYLW